MSTPVQPAPEASSASPQSAAAADPVRPPAPAQTSSASGPGPASPFRRVGERWSRLDGRRQGLALVVVGAMLLAVGGWGASLAIESPREAAATASAPPPSLITVPVEKRAVGEEIVTRGLVTATQTVEAVTALSGAGAQRALVSGRVPEPGDRVEAGDVVIEISGRPIVALEGAVPAYRDLGPGDAGPDVARLNTALARAGYATSKGSRTYGEATSAAVERLFRKAGYSSSGSLRAGEVVFVSALPASIIQVRASLGGDAAEASVQVASGDLAVVAHLSAGESGLVRPGAKVVLSSEILGKSVDATVEAAGQQATGELGAGDPAASDPAGGAGVDQESGAGQGTDQGPGQVEGAGGFRIVPDEKLGNDWAGQDVKVRVVSAVTETKVLAVPVTAVVANGSGETEVVVVKRGAKTVGEADPRRVQVTVGAVGGGWAQVTPGKGAELREGDPVQLSAPTARPGSEQ